MTKCRATLTSRTSCSPLTVEGSAIQTRTKVKSSHSLILADIKKITCWTLSFHPLGHACNSAKAVDRLQPETTVRKSFDVGAMWRCETAIEHVDKLIGWNTSALNRAQHGLGYGINSRCCTTHKETYNQVEPPSLSGLSSTLYSYCKCAML